MSEQRVVEFEGMVFTHHVTREGISKGWKHEESGEWLNAVERMYLNEIYKRGSDLTALREKNEMLQKFIDNWKEEEKTWEEEKAQFEAELKEKDRLLSTATWCGGGRGG